MIRSQKVLRSAKGQPCSARFPGICNGNPGTTVWAHLNGGAFGKGLGVKAHDVLGFHACFACHSYYDTGHGTRALIDNDTLLECVLSAVCETYVRLITAGIVIVPLDAERLSADKPVPPRKPKGQRKAIPHSSRPIPAHVGGIKSRNNLRKVKV
jgi:hypothetical protein